MEAFCMQTNTFIKWNLYFFIYCFIGWVWECCYVYLRTHHWENRGFLYGPFLPVYGMGALIILWVTIPAKGNPWLIFLLGMLGATAIEYICGYINANVLHVRYWDYSNVPFNINGHVCLLCSLVWGIFSILLVKYLHGWVEHALATIPKYYANLLYLLLVAIFTIDTIASFHVVLKK